MYKFGSQNAMRTGNWKHIFFFKFWPCTGFGNYLVPPYSTYEGCMHDIAYCHPKLCSALSDVQ